MTFVSKIRESSTICDLVTHASISLFPDKFVLKGGLSRKGDGNAPYRVRCRRQSNLVYTRLVTSSRGNEGGTVLTEDAAFQVPSCAMLPTRKIFCRRSQYLRIQSREFDIYLSIGGCGSLLKSHRHRT